MKIIFVLCAVAVVVSAVRWMAAQEEAVRRSYEKDGK